MSLSRQELDQAQAAYELIRRASEQKIEFYQHCSDKHLDFHKSNKPIRIVFGPNQCGKTIMGMTELVMRACLKKHMVTGAPNVAPGRYRIFTDSFKKAEEHVIPLLKEWVPRKWMTNGSWSDSYSDRYHMLKGRNGTYIDILTYDQDYAAAESVTLDGIWADEEMPKAFYSGSLPRLMARNGRLWWTVTPLHKLTWAMPFWEKTDDPDIDVFRLGFNDNPHLDPEWKKTFIANCPESERASRIDGTFLEFSGLVYSELDGRVHFISEERKPQYGWPVICAVDPHQRKGTFVVWAFVTPNDDVVFFDELHIKGTVEQAINAIRAKEATHGAPTTLRLIDPAANKQISGYGVSDTTLTEFQAQGMGFTLANNNMQYGTNAVKEYLKFDKSAPVSSLNRPSCYFTKQVPQTWRTMTNLLWDEFKFNKDTRDAKETIKDFEKDFPDCVRYVLAMHPTRQRYQEPVSLRMQTDFPQEY